MLLSAFCHAAWNAAVKSSNDHLVSVAGLQFACAVIAVCLAPFFPFPAQESWPWLFTSALLHSAYYIALSEAYRSGDFSQAYPVARGTAPVLVALWGVFFLKEQLSVLQLFALVGVITGILIFATRGLEEVMKNRRALSAALITAVFISCYTLVDGIGGRLSQNVGGYVIWLAILDMFPVVAYAWFRRSTAILINF